MGSRGRARRGGSRRARLLDSAVAWFNSSDGSRRPRGCRTCSMSGLPVRVYTSEPSLKRPLDVLRSMFEDLVASREIAWRLAARDIRAQYRQAALGVLWAFLLPLANAAVWMALSGSGVVRMGDVGMPYGMYVLAGTMCWAIFAEAVAAPLQQTNAARAMLAKLNFPRESLILSGVYQAAFNAAVKMPVLALALLVFGVPLDGHILLFPLGVVSLIVAGTAVGVLVTPLGMLYADVGRVVPLLMQIVMYCAPVVYPMPKGELGRLLELNPVTPLLVTTRAWLTGADVAGVGAFAWVNAGVVVLSFFVWVAYRVAMPILIERMSA